MATFERAGKPVIDLELGVDVWLSALTAEGTIALALIILGILIGIRILGNAGLRLVIKQGERKMTVRLGMRTTPSDTEPDDQ